MRVPVSLRPLKDVQTDVPANVSIVISKEDRKNERRPGKHFDWTKQGVVIASSMQPNCQHSDHFVHFALKIGDEISETGSR